MDSVSSVARLFGWGHRVARPETSPPGRQRNSIKTGSRHPREDQWRLNLTSGSTISSEIRLEADFGVGPGGTVAASKEWRRNEDDFFL
jgi:hypothetical protein